MIAAPGDWIDLLLIPASIIIASWAIAGVAVYWAGYKRGRAVQRKEHARYVQRRNQARIRSRAQLATASNLAKVFTDRTSTRDEPFDWQKEGV